MPSTARHGTARGLPLKEVLEYVVPELNIQCLRLALNSPKVPEQLLKLDEQGVSDLYHERVTFIIMMCTFTITYMEVAFPYYHLTHLNLREALFLSIVVFFC